MVAASVQYRSTRVVRRSRSLDVLRGETMIGRVMRDGSAGAYRYFPGADNDVAFVFEHRELPSLLRLIETRSWEAELERIGRG